MGTDTQVTSRPGLPQPVINIFVNDNHFTVHEARSTGAQLAALAGIPDGNQLFLEIPGPAEDRPVGRDESVELRSGMRFYDVPAGNLG